MDAETVAKGLSEACRRAIISPNVNDIRTGRGLVGARLCKDGLAEYYPAGAWGESKVRLTNFGLAVRALLKGE